MATREERTAEKLIEHQIEVIELLDCLAQHGTVRCNKDLRTRVDQAQDHLRRANAAACVLYFKKDSHQDVADVAA